MAFFGKQRIARVVELAVRQQPASVSSDFDALPLYHFSLVTSSAYSLTVLGPHGSAASASVLSIGHPAAYSSINPAKLFPSASSARSYWFRRSSSGTCVILK